MSATRTPSFSLSLHALLTLPMRLCNPPPAASTVRSCKVTPLLKVNLDDVLNKRHLPPLTLKDFEEWLVFVEGNPQYLYFILWLKEYESRYAAWLAEYGYSYAHPFPASVSSTSLDESSSPSPQFNPNVKSSTPSSKHNSSISLSSSSHATKHTTHKKNGGGGGVLGASQSSPLPPLSPSSPHLNYLPPSPSLALFFTRAKKTFFALDGGSARGPYTLILPSSVHAAAADMRGGPGGVLTFSAHPHPHPKELAYIAAFARSVLKESLKRFAVTACHNVGSRRALCGIVIGSLLTLVTGVLPTLLALFMARNRWWRLIGFLGCWMGGVVVLSSLHGICMMIYLFGDLRQLRSFELVRPAISGPRAIARARPRLRSFFTRTDDVDIEEGMAESGGTRPNGDPGTSGRGRNVGSTNINSKPSTVNPHARVNATNPASLNPSTNPNPNPGIFLSQTSTGTPIARLGFQTQLDTISEKPSHASFCSSVAASAPMAPEEFKKPSCADDTHDTDLNCEVAKPTKSATLPTPPSTDASSSETDSDLGIVVSPAYYDHNVQATWQSRGTNASGGSRSSAANGAGSRISVASRTGTVSAVGSAVMKWFKGVGTSSGATKSASASRSSEMGVGVMEEKVHYSTYSQSSPALQPQIQSQSEPPRPPSSAATFGIRSWIGGKTEPVTPVPFRESWSVDCDGYDAQGNNAEIYRMHDQNIQSISGVGTIMSNHTVVSTQNGAMMSTHGHGRPYSSTATIESFFSPAGSDRDSHLPTIPNEDQLYASAGANVQVTHWPAPPTMPSQIATASFITRDYEPAVLASLDPPAPLSPRSNSITIPSSPIHPGTRMQIRPNSHPPSPTPGLVPAPAPALVKFDFDGLPAMLASPPVSQPTRAALPSSIQPPTLFFPSPPLSPAPSTALPPLPTTNTTTPTSPPGRPRTRPAPLILVPSAPPASHIHTTLVLPSSASKTTAKNFQSSPVSDTPTPPLKPKPKRSILLWNTCPRHPAVEAKLAAAAASGVTGTDDETGRGTKAKQLVSPLSPMTNQTNTTCFTSSPVSTHSRTNIKPFSDLVHSVPFFSKTKKNATNNNNHPRLYHDAHHHEAVPTSPSEKYSSYVQATAAYSSIKKRLRSVTSVPAFGPLTRVIEPMVSRGQWEIVVRSAAYALLGAWIFVGVFVALPEVRQGRRP